LKTFKDWNLCEDLNTDIARYNSMASLIRDSLIYSDDKRIILATGPFNMLPGDVARVAITYAFAMPAKGGEADGTTEDLTGFKQSISKNGNIPLQVSDSSLIGKIIKAKQMYYQAITGIKDNNQIISGLTINSIYPNPSSQFAVINYSLPDAGNVRLSLINQLGQEIIFINDNWHEAGEYNFRFAIDDFRLNSGLYCVKLQSGSEIRTSKLVIVR
jgi:hypothetical protein